MSAQTASPIRESVSQSAQSFHQCWYPLGLAGEFTPGKVVGRDFLGSRVVAYRDPAGTIVVQSAWCPHLGADLSVGELVDGQIRCAYHHWRFDTKGVCAHIPDALEAELVVETYIRGLRNIDPWIGVSNGVDFQHLRTLHGFPAILTP